MGKELWLELTQHKVNNFWLRNEASHAREGAGGEVRRAWVQVSAPPFTSWVALEKPPYIFGADETNCKIPGTQ